MTDAPRVTVRVEQILAVANGEAARLHHEYIGTEHILLALSSDPQGVAVAALKNLGVDLNEVRACVERTVKRGPPGAPPLATRPFTSRTKRALDLAASAAREMGHSYLGTEHLLLGLLDEAKNIAAQVIWSLGVRPDQARAEIARLLGTPAK